MPNYELKARILDEAPEFIQAVKDYKRRSYLFDTVQFDEITDELEEACDLSAALYRAMPEWWDEAERMVNADNARRKRLRSRIESMFDKGTVAFLTLTFTDEVLASTSSQSRRDYVRKFLKSVSSEYVGNIDYGAENGREHYHAVVLTDKEDFSSWTYGFYKVQTVRKDGVDALRVAKYISKLTNHAIKNTTKRNALIYSR